MEQRLRTDPFDHPVKLVKKEEIRYPIEEIEETEEESTPREKSSTEIWMEEELDKGKKVFPMYEYGHHYIKKFGNRYVNEYREEVTSLRFAAETSDRPFSV